MDGELRRNKNIFRTRIPLHEFSDNENIFLNRIIDIAEGNSKEGVIAQLPENQGLLYIDTYKIVDIFRKHGDIPFENLLITANEPTSYVKGFVDGIPYVNLIHEFDGGGFVLSTRKFNGHYVVTFFEPSDSKYIESIKRRGILTILTEMSP